MNIIDYIRQLLDLAAYQGSCIQCTGSSLTDVATSFVTQGYYVQADILDQIYYNGLSNWAVLAYIVAAIGALIGAALNAPPKTYLWFLVGPAIFHWLVDNRTYSYGNEWKVGHIYEDMSQVWKMSEVGLKNSHYVQYYRIGVDREKGPDEPASVADFFAWFDEMVSDTVQQLVTMFGMNNTRPVEGDQEVEEPSDPTNLRKPGGKARWYILSHLKWQYLENITSARIKNTHLQDAWSQFMASQCGELFNRDINQKNFKKALEADGRGIGDLLGDGVLNGNGANLKEIIPTPWPLRKLLAGRNNSGLDSNFVSEAGVGAYKDYVGSDIAEAFFPPKFGFTKNPGDQALDGDVPGQRGFKDFLNSTRQDYLKNGAWKNIISCDRYLAILMHGLRWEAARFYKELTNGAPGGIDPKEFAYLFTYGWRLNTNLLGVNGTNVSGASLDAGDVSSEPSLDERQKYIENLILVHMLRNEYRLMPNRVNRQFSPTEKLHDKVELAQRNIQQQGKYGELYAWALTMRYTQGILLYILAIGYPFACLFIVMPGMHKVLFSWMSFWVWAKLWDVGFAVTMTLERSVWGLLGNSVDAEIINSVVRSVSQYNPTVIDSVNDKVSVEMVGGTIQSGFEAMWHLLDVALLLAANVDLDIANTYYIFIMSALYFAVPAVTGQLVLGAKAGVASLVTQAASAVGQEAGGIAKSAVQGEFLTKMQTTQSQARQAAYLSEVTRKNNLGNTTGSLAAKAMQYGLGGAVGGILASQREMQQRARAGAIEGVGLAANAMDMKLQGGSRIPLQVGRMLGYQVGYGQQALRGLEASLGKMGLPVGNFMSNLAGSGSKGIMNTMNSMLGAQEISAANMQNMADSMARNMGRVPGDATNGPWASVARNVSGATNWAFGNLGPNWSNPLALGKNDFLLAMNEARNFNRVESLGLGIEGYQLKQYGDMYAQAGQKFEALANFRGEMAGWDSARQYAADYSADASALGGFAGVLQPGALPINFQGMTVDGVAGLEAKTVAEASYNGLWQGWLDDKENGLFAPIHHDQAYHDRVYWAPGLQDMLDYGLAIQTQAYKNVTSEYANQADAMAPYMYGTGSESPSPFNYSVAYATMDKDGNPLINKMAYWHPDQQSFLGNQSVSGISRGDWSTYGSQSRIMWQDLATHIADVSYAPWRAKHRIVPARNK